MERMLDMLTTIILLGAGGYGLYTVIRLMRERVLFPNRFLYPSNCKPEDCTDELGFMRFVLPRLTILSVVCLVGGVVLVLCRVLELFTLPLWLDVYAIPGFVIVLFVWYITVQSRCYKRFW